ncbi:MAG: cell division protein ZapA [Burkholderiales bacterium]|nr:MAG: cell division protein ZapA [Burkholderiales bacterium]TAG82245.1 MAG: cell division protein ZapA [Betaproteobacteria bacterium]
MTTDALIATIKGRTFKLNAPEAQRGALAEAIAVVEAKCATIATKSPSSEIERVLLLAALELAAASKDADAIDPRLEARLAAMHAKLALALAPAGVTGKA